MSAPATKRPDVPAGETEFYTTKQKAPTDSGYRGYDVEWKPFQKEQPYQKPKTP